MTLFPYQIEGINWLKTKRYALLSDEMGLGKTVQAIKAVDTLNLAHILVICPMVARINWQREFEMWSNNGREYQILEKLTDKPTIKGVIICSYNYATSSLKSLLASHRFDALIIDEAHFLKTPKSKRTKSILGRQGLYSHTDRVWMLSGTPATNHAGELWVMCRTFGLTSMTHNQWLEHFCHLRKTTYGMQVTGTDRSKTPQLREVLKPIMLRRLKRDVMKELPPLNFGHVTVEGASVTLSRHQSFMKYFYPIDDTVCLKKNLQDQLSLLNRVYTGMNKANEKTLPAIEAVAETVATARRFIGLQKVEPVVDMVTRAFESKAYDKLVIFAIHRDVIDALRIALKKFYPVTLYGGTPPKKRQRNIDRFQNTNKYKIFIGNIQAAGTAITLTRAHHVLFIEQDWTPGNNAQAIMRCHRIGQENPVSVKFVAINNSIDSRIMFLLKKKTKELTEIFD